MCVFRETSVDWWEVDRGSDCNYDYQGLLKVKDKSNTYRSYIGIYWISYIIKVERTDFMAVALKEDYQRALDEQKNEVRELVMAGLEQIKEGKTKDFNTVCDRLEKKYRDEAISN